MLNMENRLVFGLTIGGREVPIEQFSLGNVQLSENDLMGLPCGELKFGDPIMWIKKSLSLRKGMPVTIRLGRSMMDAQTYKFVIWNYKDVEEQASIVYTLLLMLDNESYIDEGHTSGQNKSSNDVMKWIAATHGLTFKGVSTNDVQLWLPLNKTGFRWALDVASKGWVDEKSCMRVGVTLQGELRYANVMDITKEKAKAAPQFLHGADKLPPAAFKVWSKSFGDISGYRNAIGGQKTAQQEQNLTTDSAVQDKAVLTRKAAHSNVQKEGPASSKVDVAPIDAGNSHAKLHQARYQNTRLWMLHSNMLALAVMDVTGVSLYDFIYVQVIDVHNSSGVPAQNPDQSGVYVVVGKTIFVSPTGQYVEKIVVCREGNNGNVDNGDDRK